MKHLRIPSLILAGMLALSILPCALATDNPEDETIQNNKETIANNYGTIVTNTDLGYVEKNYYYIETNDGGKVEDNQENAEIGTNQNGGKVDNNYGKIGTNDGAEVHNNAEGAEIETNQAGGKIINNYGEVGTNKKSEIEEEHSKVSNNYGTIGKNEDYVACNTYDESGKQAVIKTNAETGTVVENNGIIETNEGLVETNAVADEIRGTITDNYADVTQNNGYIINNKEDGTVATNLGGIEYNYGTVQNNSGFAQGAIGFNYGIVEANDGTVTNNHGEIKNNDGVVLMNQQDGKIVNAEDATKAAIMVNYGIVENASLFKMEDKLLPFGEGVVAGTNTLVGITYAREGVVADLGEAWNKTRELIGEDLNPVEQWVTDDGAYVIKDYSAFEKYLGELGSGKKFVGWKDADGKKYKVGDLYNKLSPLQLTAIIKAIQKAEKKSASKVPSLTIHVNEDGSFLVKGGSINNFIAVTVDDELVDPINYTLAVDENGRMMILFTDAFLQSLAAGEHPVMLCFSNGTSHSTLIV